MSDNPLGAALKCWWAGPISLKWMLLIACPAVDDVLSRCGGYLLWPRRQMNDFRTDPLPACRHVALSPKAGGTP
jgi:hypothetical protein